MSGAGNVYAQMDGAPAAPSGPTSGGGANVYAQMDGQSSEPGNDNSQGTTWSGVAKNFGAGALEGLTGLIGYVPKAAMAVIDPAGSAARTLTPIVTGRPQPDLFAPGTITHGVNAMLGPANPENVPSNSGLERVVRVAGAGASTGLIAGPGTSIGALMASAAKGAAIGAGAGAAEEVAPGRLKPLAGLVGGLAVGGLVGGVSHAIPATSEAVARATAPIRAISSPAAADRLAAETLASRATDPNAVRAATANGPVEAVPGSEPTTFQQTGDMGLGALEREMATKYPDLFRERQATQNAARVASLGNIQQGGDPAAVSSFLNRQFRAFDDNYDNEIALRASAAHQKAEALGGQTAPEVQGANMRAALSDAETAARDKESTLWKAVDPNGDLTGNVSATKAEAADIASSLRPTAKPMTGEEAAIFDAAKSLPPLAPVADLIALRSRTSTEMRNELIANGRSPTYARLSLLRGAIQNNLSRTIADQVEQESAQVSAGEIQPQDTVASRLEGWRNDYYARQRQQAGAAGAEGAGPSAAEPATPGAGPNGTGTEIPEGQGSPGSPAGLPGNAPTFDEAAADRLKLATAATRERAGTYGRGPVADVMRRAGTQDIFRLPEAVVPGKFFHPGPRAFQDIQDLNKAIGADRATPLLADYAATSLRRAAMREDGTLDVAKFARWRQAHADALRALPDAIRNQFNDAHQSSNALAQITQARTAALKDMQAGAIGKIMGASDPEDVTAKVISILRGPNSLAEFKAVARQAAKDPAAMAGLRQAVADYVAKNLISNTEVGTSGVNQIKADMFQTFMKQNRQHLAQIFSEQEMKNLDAIAADIKQSKRSEQAVKLPGQSNTPQDMTAIGRNAVGRSILRVIVGAGGGALGEHVGTMFGHPGVGTWVGVMGGEALTAMRNAGLERVDKLVAQALLHPQIAHELLKKVPAKGAAGDGLGRALRRVAANATLLSAAQAQQRSAQ